MTSPEPTAQTESSDATWFRELVDANTALPAWLLVLFLSAGLVGFVAALFSLFAG